MADKPGTLLILGGTDEQRQAARSAHPYAMPIELPVTATADEIREAVARKRAPHLETRVMAYAEPAIGRDAVHDAVVAGDTHAAIRWTTMACHGQRWTRHAIGHCERIARGEVRFVDEVEDELRVHLAKKDGRGLIVGAGPSLGTQGEHLWRAWTRALTAVCDTAVARARDIGIVPDLVCTIESVAAATEPIPRAFCGEILIYGPQSNPESIVRLEDLGYRCVMAPYAVGGLGRIFRRFGVPTWTTGGSVGTAAYTTLGRLGATEIWGVGIDSCLSSDGRTYPEGVLFEPKARRILYEIPGRDSPKVTTTQAYDHYRKWFESAARENKGIAHHNASVGGAWIEGWRPTDLCDIGCTR